MKKQKDILILLTASFIIRIVFFLLTDDIFGDPADKIVEALRWIQSPELITHGYWLPLHNYLIACVILIFKNPSVSPRILSITAGTLTIIPYYLLVKRLFSKKTAFYSGIFLSLLYYHILYSTQTMNDTIFILFSVLSLLFFFRIYDNRSKENIPSLAPLICGISLLLAGMTRVEGWILIPVMFFALSIKKEYREAFIIAGISSIFPLAWFAGNYLALGSILPLADINISTTALSNYSILEKIFIYPYMILKTLTPIAALLAFSGYFISMVNKKNIMLVLIIAVEIAFLTLTVIKGTNAFPKPRYCLLTGILLIPFISESFETIEQRGRNIFKGAVIAFLIFSIPATYLYFCDKDSTSFFPNMPLYAVRTGKWMKENLKAGDKVFLDSFSWWNSNIAVLSGINPYNLARIYPDPYPGIITGKKFYLRDDNGLERYLDEENPDYIIFSPGGTLDKWTGKSFLFEIKNITPLMYSVIYTSTEVVVIKFQK